MLENNFLNCKLVLILLIYTHTHNVKEGKNLVNAFGTNEQLNDFRFPLFIVFTTLVICIFKVIHIE